MYIRPHIRCMVIIIFYVQLIKYFNESNKNNFLKYIKVEQIKQRTL